MSGAPCLLSSDGSVIPLTAFSKRRDPDSNLSEQLLQRALDVNPTMLPYRTFFPAARQILSLGMEYPIPFPRGRPAGKIDNLLLMDDGHFVVVEMKLWRNPEAIREVVG